jgi:hypothetical protein
VQTYEKTFITVFKNFIPRSTRPNLVQRISIVILFYRLPDTEEKQPEPYEKDKRSAQIRCQIFEYKICAQSLLQPTNKGYKFQLASNMKGLGAFDDDVVEYLDGTSRRKHIFVQLKSKVKQHITMQQLLAEKGDQFTLILRLIHVSGEEFQLQRRRRRYGW